MPFKDASFYSSKHGKSIELKWPDQLSTPKQVIQALQNNTKLRLIRSPICSKLVLQFIGSWSYFLAHFLNTTKIYNVDVFNKELRRTELQLSESETKTNLEERSFVTRRGPLLTFSNHISCIDDPILWGCLLPFSYYTSSTEAVRWSAAAVEICFSKPWHSTFFSLGKTFPIIRGYGLEQPAMNFASGLLNHNQWLHLFPEGKVMRDDQQQEISNRERGYIFKWGISKLILDYFKNDLKYGNTRDTKDNVTDDKIIRILPFYHSGLDKILPIGWPYIPRARKLISIYIRPTVIEMNKDLLTSILKSRQFHDQQQWKSKSNDDITRIKLTNYLEEEFEKIAEHASSLHKSNSD